MTESTQQSVPVQLHQTNQLLVLAAPLPGLDPQDITVHIEGHTVRIAGAERGSRQGQPEILVSEWTIGPYYREIRLPQPVNGTLTNATYGNGVLVLAMPLLEGGAQEGPTAFRLEATTSATGQRVGHTGSAHEPTHTQAHRAVTALQEALARPPHAEGSAPPRAVWEAILQQAEGYDAVATAAVDPSQTNQTAVFVDGSRLWWNAARQAWETGPAAAAGRTGEPLHQPSPPPTQGKAGRG